MSTFMLLATGLTLVLALGLVLLLADALHRERLDDERRMLRRARALRLPTVLTRAYVGVERRRTVRDTRDGWRRAA